MCINILCRTPSTHSVSFSCERSFTLSFSTSLSILTNSCIYDNEHETPRYLNMIECCYFTSSISSLFLAFSMQSAIRMQYYLKLLRFFFFVCAHVAVVVVNAVVVSKGRQHVCRFIIAHCYVALHYRLQCVSLVSLFIRSLIFISF